jgi:hypothetical protein
MHNKKHDDYWYELKNWNSVNCSKDIEDTALDQTFRELRIFLGLKVD